MGLIIVGYQGIGKSTYASSEHSAIDLESSNFFIDGVRPDYWEAMYVRIAQHLSNQGYTVFLSSHKGVRLAIKELGMTNAYAIVPSTIEGIKNEWILKLENRYRETELYKDYKAWKNAADKYDENVQDIIDDIGPSHTVIIADMNYDLGSLVDGIKLIDSVNVQVKN